MVFLLIENAYSEVTYFLPFRCTIQQIHLMWTAVLAESDSNQTHAMIQTKHFLFFFFFNFKLFGHRISNVLPLDDFFLSFVGRPDGSHRSFTVIKEKKKALLRGEISFIFH